MSDESQEDRQREQDKLKEVLRRARRAPESRSVTKQELRRLPLRASVALAARYARRVRPLFQTAPDDPQKEESFLVVDLAIKTAEAVAGSAWDSNLVGGAAYVADQAERLSRRALPWLGRGVAYAVARAAAAAATAVEGEPEDVLNHAATAFRAGADAVTSLRFAAGDLELVEAEMRKAISGQVSDRGPDEMRDALADDFEKLLAMGLGEFPSEGEPIDSTDQGPLGDLWPQGAPDWYTART